MNRSTLVRLEKLEQMKSAKQSGRILVAGSSSEAAKLRESYPDALIICTGVIRQAGGVV
jgi:hypothetical protein